MAVYDRWHKTLRDPTGKASKVRSADYGCEQRWQVRWRDDAGKQRKRNFAKKEGGDPDQHAEAFDAQTKHQLNQGTYIDPSAGAILFKHYAEPWRETRVCNIRSLEGYDRRLKHIYAGIGHRPMVLLSKRPSLIQAWVKRMEDEGISAQYIKDMVDLTSAIFAAAISDGIISRNPCRADTVTLPTIVKKKFVPWEVEQLAAVVDGVPEQWQAIAYTAAGCGHRQGEAFAINVDAVNFLRRMISIDMQVCLVNGVSCFDLPKGGKTVDVPIPDHVAFRLARHIETHPPVEVTLPWGKPTGELVTAKLLFTNDGKALHKDCFNPHWRRALKAAGLPAERRNMFHMLRHIAATSWLRYGVDIRTVSEYLRHADPGFTLRTYTQFMPNAAERARKAMNLYFETLGSDVAGGTGTVGR